MKTPIEVLYASQGHTAPLTETLSTTPCSHCHQNLGTVLTKKTLSHNFTQWDSLQENLLPMFCSSCAWSYAAPEAKRYRLLITPTRCLTMPSEEGLRLLKTAPEETALIFAIQGQKQLLPHLLNWGTAVTDVRSFLWHQEHTQLIEAIKSLKAMGLTEKDLIVENPQPAEPLREFYNTWLRFTDLRSKHSDLLTLAIWLSR